MVSFVRKWKQLNLSINRLADLAGSRSIWGSPTKTAKFNYTPMFSRNLFAGQYPVRIPGGVAKVCGGRRTKTKHSKSFIIQRLNPKKISTICCVECQCQCVVMTLSFSLPFMSEMLVCGCVARDDIKPNSPNSQFKNRFSHFKQWIRFFNHLEAPQAIIMALENGRSSSARILKHVGVHFIA